MSTLAAAPADESGVTESMPEPTPLSQENPAIKLPAQDEPIAPATAPAPWAPRWHWVFLLVLTLLAGYARFAWIGKPPLWGDEAHTYSRAGGDYRDLLDILQGDGFVPLHYNIYWVIVRICQLGQTGRMLIRVIGTIVSVIALLPVAYLLLRSWLSAAIERFFERQKNLRARARLAARLATLALAAAATFVIGLAAYALLNRISRVTFVTPGVMRFLPALAGTLMVPAIYWLAIQIVRPPVALCASLLTACSAYMFVYSHDAKMYVQAWLLAVISVSCLLWWMRSGRRGAWLGWIASGLAAVGIHASCIALPPVELVLLLTYRRPWRAIYWKQALLFLIGFGAIMAGPAGYYLGFNRWADRVDEMGWNVSGISWVQEYNQGRTGPELALYATTAHLYSWEWPQVRDRAEINIYTLNALMIGGVLAIGLAALGAIGWSMKLRGIDPSPPLAKENTAGMNPAQRASRPTQPWWRQFLWLSAWILLPAYGFYCRSTEHFVSPGDWLSGIGDLFSGNALYVALEVPILLGAFFLLRFVKPLRWCVALALAFVAGKIVYNAHLWKPDWHSASHLSPFAAWAQSVRQWPPLPRGAWALLAGALLLTAILAWRAGANWRRRLLRIGLFIGVYLLLIALAWAVIVSGQQFQEQWLKISTWPAMLQSCGLIAAVLLVAMLISAWYCGPTWNIRAKKSLQFAAVVLALYGGCRVVYAAVQQVWTSAANKVLADHSERQVAYSWSSTVAAMRDSHGVPSRQTALSEAAADRPLASPRAIEKAADARIAAAKTRWDRLVKKDGEQKAAETLAAGEMVWSHKWESRWMPRYIGILWPAVIIALSALLLRLPTAPLRWAAVALVLTLNLGQAYGRMFAGSEPPIGRIEQDIAAGQPVDANGNPTPTDTRTYGDLQYSLGGHPGSLGLGAPPAKYYAMVARHKWLTPIQFRDWGIGQIDQVLHVRLWPYAAPMAVARDVRDDPALNRIIVWQMVDAGSTRQIEGIAGALPQWKIIRQDDYHGRMHWWWKDLYTLRRTVFEKTP